MASINFIWDELGINETYQKFIFSAVNKTDSVKKELYCAKITPQLEYEGKAYNYIHFTKLDFINSTLSTHIGNTAISLFPLKRTHTLEMCQPGIIRSYFEN